MCSRRQKEPVNDRKEKLSKALRMNLVLRKKKSKQKLTSINEKEKDKHDDV